MAKGSDADRMDRCRTLAVVHMRQNDDATLPYIGPLGVQIANMPGKSVVETLDGWAHPPLLTD